MKLLKLRKDCPYDYIEDIETKKIKKAMKRIFIKGEIANYEELMSRSEKDKVIGYSKNEQSAREVCNFMNREGIY